MKHCGTQELETGRLLLRRLTMDDSEMMFNKWARDPEVTRYLRWNAPFYAVLGVLIATRYALQSLGQKVLPLFSSVIEFVGKILFVLFFIPRFQYNAVILCEPLIWCVMAAYLVAVYRRDAFVFGTDRTRKTGQKGAV